MKKIKFGHILFTLCLAHVALRAIVGLSKSDFYSLLFLSFFAYILRASTGANDLAELAQWVKLRKKAFYFWLTACFIIVVQLAISPGSGYVLLAGKLAAAIMAIVFFAACIAGGEWVKEKFNSTNGNL